MAGGGQLPLLLARAIRQGGWRVVCVQIDGSPAELRAASDVHVELRAGEVGRVLQTLRAHGVRRVVLAGTVRKLPALGGELDSVAQALLAQAGDRQDRSLWRAAARFLEASGFEILPQVHFTPTLLTPQGPLGRCRPTSQEFRDLEFGLGVARAVADLGIGQAVAVRGGIVLAVEAAEGTDGMIRRLAPFGPGAVVAKAAPTEQDPRFDLPTAGPETIRAMHEVGARALGLEAARTLLLERETTLALADEAGIAVVGL